MHSQIAVILPVLSWPAPCGWLKAWQGETVSAMGLINTVIQCLSGGARHGPIREIAEHEDYITDADTGALADKLV